MLPLLIGDLIPVDDEHWENFLRLLKVEEIVFAPRTSVQLAAYLAVLTEEYLAEFSELHERSMIPKAALHGPLSKTNCKARSHIYRLAILLLMQEKPNEIFCCY